MRYLLALDQATQDTGWALFEDKKLIDFGVFSPPGEIEDRLVQLRQWVENFIQKYKGDIYVVIEDIQLQNTFSKDLAVTTYCKLAWVQGILLELLTSNGVPHHSVYSSSWKSTCGITGQKRQQQKANAAKYVLNTFNITAKQDACDAICIGQHTILKDLANQ